MITFDPATGLTAQSTSEIRAAIADDWEAVFSDETYSLNTGNESPAGQIIDSLAVLATAKDSEIINLSNQFNPKVADGQFQDALAAIYFLTRKTAQPTVVTCQCTGLYGTTIPAGSIIQNAGGYKLASISAATIPPEGTADVEFACQDTGPIPIGANTCTKIITVIAGWDTVNNAAAGVLGQDIETRAAFENRRRNSVASNAHGSRMAVQGALLSVDGVTDCLVLDNRTDGYITNRGVYMINHSIAIIIYGGADGDIAEAIYNKLDAGCGTNGNTAVQYTAPDDGIIYTYQIIRPQTIAVYITVKINLTDTTPSTIVQDVKQAVYNDFYGLDTNSGNVKVTLGDTIYASRFSVAIIKSAGVSDLVGITIGREADPTGNAITFNANELPVLDMDNIEVILIDPNAAPIEPADESQGGD